MNAVTAALKTALAYLDKLAPRERALIAILLAIGAVYGLMQAWDWSNTAADRAQTANGEYVSAEQSLKQANDTRMQKLVAERVGLLRQWSYSAGTLAIARVEAQTALRDAAVAASIPDAKVSLDPAPAGADMLMQNLVIEGKFKWRTVLAFCDRLANTKQAHYLTSMSIVAGREPTFRMVVQTPVVAEAP